MRCSGSSWRPARHDQPASPRMPRASSARSTPGRWPHLIVPRPLRLPFPALAWIFLVVLGSSGIFLLQSRETPGAVSPESTAGQIRRAPAGEARAARVAAVGAGSVDGRAASLAGVRQWRSGLGHRGRLGPARAVTSRDSLPHLYRPPCRSCVALARPHVLLVALFGARTEKHRAAGGGEPSSRAELPDGRAGLAGTGDARRDRRSHAASTRNHLGGPGLGRLSRGAVRTNPHRQADARSRHGRIPGEVRPRYCDRERSIGTSRRPSSFSPLPHSFRGERASRRRPGTGPDRGARRRGRPPDQELGGRGAAPGLGEAARERRLVVAGDDRRHVARLQLALALHRNPAGGAWGLLHLSTGAGSPGLVEVRRPAVWPSHVLEPPEPDRRQVHGLRRSLHPPGSLLPPRPRSSTGEPGPTIGGRPRLRRPCCGG